MKKYQEDFVRLLVEKEALRFGEFTLKSGRKSPYFVNMGAIDDGPSLRKLGEFYAGLLSDRFAGRFNVLFGPAYKGIPLATAAAVALSRDHGTDVRVSFDRKEAKAHGERGSIFGYVPRQGDRVVIIDDVFTTGGTKEETLDLLGGLGGVECTGVAIAVDRQEAQTGDRSAVQVFQDERGIPVRAVVTIREMVDHLASNRVIDDEMNDRIAQYLSRYGAKTESSPGQGL
jgi:orotate phosphoribosyltransferase